MPLKKILAYVTLEGGREPPQLLPCEFMIPAILLHGPLQYPLLSLSDSTRVSE